LLSTLRSVYHRATAAHAHAQYHRSLELQLHNYIKQLLHYARACQTEYDVIIPSLPNNLKQHKKPFLNKQKTPYRMCMLRSRQTDRQAAVVADAIAAATVPAGSCLPARLPAAALGQPWTSICC
jgi:hypothetical protein